MKASFFLPTNTSSNSTNVKPKLIHQYAYPGQPITSESGHLRGHGTYEKEEELIASVSGLVERVGKLISVKALKSRYNGEVGDVVVGRIVEVAQKLWRVNVHSKQEAILMLSAIHLPGGALRRRTTSDELQMRDYFSENDVISAEVQQIKQDGTLALHTRSAKYGKLSNGILIQVPSVLIKRVKNHFYSFNQFNVDVILGLNGNIWISESSNQLNNKNDLIEEEMEEIKIEKINEERNINSKSRERISRTYNSILALSTCFLPIYPDTIAETYESSIELKIETKDIIKPDIIDQVTQKSKIRCQNQ